MFQIKINEMRSLPDNTLKEKLNELNLQLSIEKRKIASTGVSSKVVKTKELRKAIARIKTILNQRGTKL